jgi:hypothetical protein
MTADPIHDIVAHLSQPPAARASIEHEADPARPSRLVYRITASTREAVQSAITDLMNKVDDGSGYAVFSGPRRCEGGYIAHGAVVVYEPAERAP